MTSTNDIEVAYGYYQAKFRGIGFGTAGEELDSWLNEERAKVWSEGYASGQDSIYTSTNGWANPNIRNPYRKETP